MAYEKIMFLFARTPVHVGAGNSVGAVDSPVMRERHTGIPVIPGSSIKGVISDEWNEKGDDGEMKRSREGVVLFGTMSNCKEDLSAGALTFGDASVLAFPVRSAKNAFAWITCPMVLKKFARSAGCEAPQIKLSSDECYASNELVCKFSDNKESVVLEEYALAKVGEAQTIAETLLQNTFADDAVWGTVAERLVVVSDEMFSFYVRNACEVVTRIRINDKNGVVEPGALFNQEQVPSETLFYSVVGANINDALTKLEKKVPKVIQIGGDATIGLGFCQVAFKEVK